MDSIHWATLEIYGRTIVWRQCMWQVMETKPPVRTNHLHHLEALTGPCSPGLSYWAWFLRAFLQLLTQPTFSSWLPQTLFLHGWFQSPLILWLFPKCTRQVLNPFACSVPSGCESFLMCPQVPHSIHPWKHMLPGKPSQWFQVQLFPVISHCKYGIRPIVRGSHFVSLLRVGALVHLCFSQSLSNACTK